jgi:hypothetical protein
MDTIEYYEGVDLTPAEAHLGYSMSMGSRTTTSSGMK